MDLVVMYKWSLNVELYTSTDDMVKGIIDPLYDVFLICLLYLVYNHCVYFNNTYPDTLLWFIPNCHQDIDI